MSLRDYTWKAGTILSMPILTHIVHHELEAYGGLKNIAYQAFNTYIMPLLGRANPGAFAEIEEFLADVKKNGSFREAIKQNIQQGKAKCAAEAGMSLDKVDVIIKCVRSVIETDGDIVAKGQAFASCAQINPFKLVAEMKNVSAFATCVSDDIKDTAKQAQAVVASLGASLSYFSDVIAKVEKNGNFKSEARDQLKQAVETCAHNVGGNSGDAQQKIDCFTEMLHMDGGVTQKLQVFVACNHLTVYNAHDHIYNAMSLAQCVDGVIKSQLASVFTDFEGNFQPEATGS